MVTIACSGKFHAFALAEQMERLGELERLYTTYAYQKNSLLAKAVKRIDKENIPAQKISTNSLLAFPIKLFPGNSFLWNDFFDNWVASKLAKLNSRIFIGWSGMSLHAIRKAKSLKMTTILERGSSHILYQNDVLKEEYQSFGKKFSIDVRVIEKELAEYELADFISVPSFFVKNSFIEKGVSPSKLIMNPYGASQSFHQIGNEPLQKNEKFTIVYLGSLTIRKGLVYLFRAIAELKISEQLFDVWFIGKVDPEIEPIIEQYKKSNWTFFGHINHYELRNYLVRCHVGIQPSVEEGLSMVIPQMMASGLPLIVTPNSGGENIVKNGVNGFVVPIRQPIAIAEKLQILFNDADLLQEMSKNASQSIRAGFTWDDYGDRYMNFLKGIS